MAKPVSESRGTGMCFWYESVLRGIYIRAAGAEQQLYVFMRDRHSEYV